MKRVVEGEALPRDSGKYLPSQLRTQNAGPETEATGRGVVAGCWLRPNGSAKKLACGGACCCCCCFCEPPKKKSNRPSAEARGAKANVPASAVAATNITRRRDRGRDRTLRNANSTQRNKTDRGDLVPQL